MRILCLEYAVICAHKTYNPAQILSPKLLGKGSVFEYPLNRL